MLSAPVGAVNARVQEWIAEHVGELPRFAEVAVVTVTLAGQERVDRMVKIVGPLPPQPVPSAFRRQEDADVVHVALGDQVNLSAGPRADVVGDFLKFAQQVLGAQVKNTVDRVKAEAVESKLLQPHAGVFENEVA